MPLSRVTLRHPLRVRGQHSFLGLCHVGPITPVGVITKTVAIWDGALVCGLRLARRTLEAARSLVEERVVEQDAARPVAGVGVAVHHGAVPGVALQPTDEARVLHLPGTVVPAGTPPLPAAPPLATRTLVHGPLHVAHGALGVGVALRFLEPVVACSSS